MTDSLQDFLQELAEAGDTQGTGSCFTLRSDKAREKLKKFALAHPENYFLLVLAGLHALGGRRFSMRVDADDLEIRCDCRIEPASLANLWESVAGGKAENSGLRLLGLAILTSVRFGTVAWSIDSFDYAFRQLVKGEELADPSCAPLSSPVEGTTVRVKRKDVKSVATRFFSQLSRRLLSRDWDEEKLISERVFLGTMAGFEFNSKALSCQAETQPALAVLRVGDGLESFSGKHLFVEQGDLNVAVVLGKGSDLPGQAKKVSWLWHGLRMGETRLGLSYDFCRAFALADDLRCDLSLTSVADTWARQKAVRQAREAVRRALELLAGRYREIQEEHWDPRDEEMEECLLEVLGKRIDIRRNRHRMGSFNDTLLRCPLFPVSTPDGLKRRADLFEIWEWIEKGQNPALFREESEWREVEAWSDRPVVIYATQRHSSTLIEIFGENAFHRGTTIARSIEKLVAGGKLFRAPQQPVLSGEIAIDGCKLAWALEIADQGGVLTVIRDGRIYFEDRALSLPAGLQLYGEVPWEPNFGGRLSDRELAGRLEGAARRAIAIELDRKTEEPTAADYEAMSTLIRSLGSDWVNWQKSGLDKLCWLVGQGRARDWVSPGGWARKLEEQGLPYYYTTVEQAEQRSPQSLESLPFHLVLSSGCLKTLPPNFQDVQGVELLQARAPYVFPDRNWVTVTVGKASITRAPDDLVAVCVGFPEADADHRGQGVDLELNLRGHKLQTRPVNSFVGPAVVCLELEGGWPDSRGRHLVDKDQMEALKSLLPDILTEAGRELCKSVSAEGLSRLHEDVQRTVLVDLWSEGERDFEGRILTAAGERVSLAELGGRREIGFFSEWSRAAEVGPETVFLTAVQATALRELAEVELLDCLQPALELPSAPLVGAVETSSRLRRAAAPEIRAVEAAPTSEIIPEKKREQPGEAVEAVEVAEKPRPLPSHSLSAAVEAPGDPEPPLERVRDATPSGPTVTMLGELLSTFLNEYSVPFPREFEFFLTTIREVEKLESALREENGKLLVRRLENPNRDQLLALLSAVYTYFNRSLENVEDSHERDFHQALVQFAGRR